MREILFRGKKITSGEWVVGNYNQNVLNRGFDTIEDLENFPYLYYGVDYNTVGQYTGLTDKNGKRIFEGDVVRCDSGRICKVVYFVSPECALFDLVPVAGFDMPAPHLSSLFAASEVIGNIHDNPELLNTEVEG